MIGKVWILITAFSFITYVHHVRSECMDRDIKTHLDDLLLEEHMFEIKKFSTKIKEHELLSVINSLCSTWTKNKKKAELKVILTFKIMLDCFSDESESFCANLNCTDAYTVSWVNTTVFGDMYRRSCNGSISDLKCPLKSTTTTTMVDSITTAYKSATSLTTVSPNTTCLENLSTVSSAFTATRNGTIKTFSGVLVVSLLLNIILFLLVLKRERERDLQKNRQTAEQARGDRML
ncbi:uncharacterized protein [Pseudorasbora parva]|uniref:uncharacterized protein n=1 Tax=Pseudorasbora parva TaxID=51549 RepID=UPI00351EDB46